MKAKKPGPSRPNAGSARAPVIPITLGLAGLFVLAARVFPLGELEDLGVVSGYGTYDNRRLLLTFAALLAAALAGPLLAFILNRTGRRPPEFDAGRRGDAPAAAIDGAARNNSPRRIALALAAAILTGVVLIGPGVAYRALNGHELVHLGYLNEIEHGRVLNADTRVTYGPLLGYSMWAFMKLVRFDLVGFRLYWNAVNALFLGALFLVAARWFRRPGLLVTFAFYAILGTSAAYFLPDAAGINGGFWGLGNVARQGWTALVILGLGGWLIASASPWPRFLAGVGIGIGAFYSQETLFPALVSVGFLLWAARPAPLRSRIQDAVAVATGGALVGIVMLAPVVLRGRLDEYVTASRHVSALFLQGFGNRPYPELFSAGSLIYYIFPAGVLGLLALHWNRRLGNPATSRIELPLAVYAGLSTVNLLVRADREHLLNVSLTPLLVLFLTMDDGLIVEREPTTDERRAGEREPRPAAGAPARLRIPIRVRSLVAPALLLPLFFFRPGLVDLARGLAGRVTHWSPPPPGGFTAIPGQRAGIWTPAESWFDNAGWGTGDDAAAAGMIHHLAGGRPVFITGSKSSLYYFLSDVPCAIPYTDLSSQCFTRDDFKDVGQAVLKAQPDFIFVKYPNANEKPPEEMKYRLLTKSHGFWIFQRGDLPPIPVQPAPG